MGEAEDLISKERSYKNEKLKELQEKLEQRYLNFFFFLKKTLFLFIKIIC